jgi:hypothetical protein
LPFSVPERLLDYLFPNKGSGRLHVVILIGELNHAQESKTVSTLLPASLSRDVGCLLNGKLFLSGEETKLGKGNVKSQVRLLLSSRYVSRVFLHLSLADFRALGIPTPYFSQLIVNLPEEAEKEVLSDPSVVSLCHQMKVTPRRDFKPDLIFGE